MQKQENNNQKMNVIYYKSSTCMGEISDNTIDCIITSPPYFNIKDYSLDGKQEIKHSNRKNNDAGNQENFDSYLNILLLTWKECYRVLKPNGKLCINVPLVPILKAKNKTFHNRYIYDLQSQIQSSVLNNTKFNLLDIYIWNRTNSSKKLMFGSYPYPGNFYAQNTCEFISIYVKPGKPIKIKDNDIKEKSKLSKEEWINFTKQIWNIPSPNKGDKAFGIHPAIMPLEIADRCVRLFTYVNDVILDPFVGSGTTLLSAKKNKRNFIGYELYNNYKEIIEKKVNE